MCLIYFAVTTGRPNPIIPTSPIKVVKRKKVLPFIIRLIRLYAANVVIANINGNKL